MKLTKLSLAMASVIGAGFAADAMAMNLYVDTKTQQIFAEPGAGRVLLGAFEKVEDQAAQKAEIEKIKEDLALKNNAIKALDEHVNDPAEGKLHINEKGIKFESKDGNFEMSLNGRMQVDSQMNVQDASPSVANGNSLSSQQQLADGVNIRRARLGVEGTYYKDYEYKFEYDFSRGGNSGVAAGITDAYINWKGYDPLGVKVGSFKEPFSLEEATSNRWITFIERNMAVNAFSDNPNAYKTGLGLTWSQPRWTAAGALMTEPVGGGWAYTTSRGSNGNNNRNGGSGDSSWELTGRVTALPWFADKTKFLHIGASGSERYFDNSSTQTSNGTTTNSNGMSFNAALNSNV
ncbi:MAG: OprO/OprP family phosphate-selective porin, partial [Methylomonas sp.]